MTQLPRNPSHQSPVTSHLSPKNLEMSDTKARPRRRAADARVGTRGFGRARRRALKTRAPPASGSVSVYRAPLVSRSAGVYLS